MAFVQDIIINISRGTKGLQRLNFRPLVIGSHATTAIPLAIVTSLTDMISEGYTSSDDEYKMVAAMLAQSPSPQDIAVRRKVDATDYDDELDTILTTFTSFWGVLIDSRTIADLNDVGTWANSNKRFFFGCVDDVTAGSGRDVDREAYLVHDTPGDFPEAAWVGQNIPKQPGSFTWKWKQLNGQIAAGYTSTQLATIRTNNTQALQEQAGAIYTNEGIATSGEYVDVIEGQDWVENQLETELLALMLANDKVSLDDPGIAQIEGVLRAVLKRAGDAGIIAIATSKADKEKSDDKIFMYQVTVPARADLSAGDLANRELTGVEIIYYLAGAIHKTTITGLITV